MGLNDFIQQVTAWHQQQRQLPTPINLTTSNVVSDLEQHLLPEMTTLLYDTHGEVQNMALKRFVVNLLTA
jgi:hypothetical protein